MQSLLSVSYALKRVGLKFYKVCSFYATSHIDQIAAGRFSSQVNVDGAYYFLQSGRHPRKVV